MERRRFLLISLAGALTAFAREAQTGQVYRVGFLWDTPAVWPHALEAFRQGLRELGWVEGQNLVMEYRWAEGRFEQLPGYVEELLRLKVDVIVAPTSIYTGAAKRATSTVPIVFISHADPVGSAHVASLARPGGNATGLTIVMSETMAKSVELLKATIPGLRRLAVIWDPATPSHRPGLRAVEESGRALGLQVQALAVRSATEYEATFAAMVQERAGAVLVLSTPLFMGGARRLAELALTHRLPTMFGPREHVEAGGLLSYSPDRADLYRRAASYVDRILKGANPADLPVQQAEKFELVITESRSVVEGARPAPMRKRYPKRNSSTTFEQVPRVARADNATSGSHEVLRDRLHPKVPRRNNQWRIDGHPLSVVIRTRANT